MRDITEITQQDLPSAASLIKATLGAAVLGGALLITTVLPAEYGIDPTGLGKAMGLTALNSSAASAEGAGASALLTKRDEPHKTRTLTLQLAPGQGTEIKARMNAGERFVYHWQSEGGPVNFDMHGEPPNAAKDEFTSYWFARDMSSASGAFTAPFSGTHDWYWRNRGQETVTVKVSVSGFYRDIFMP